MLKIKEGIPLKILLSYGFVYNKEYNYYSERDYFGRFEISEDDKRIIRIVDDIYNDDDLNILYDLINDGLVEKVK